MTELVQMKTGREGLQSGRKVYYALSNKVPTDAKTKTLFKALRRNYSVVP